MPTVVDRKPIRALPALLVNQIAAGEVVDRPASVVKELVENAIDAGARRITLELEQGGIELIRVTDDGCGIPRAELPLALAAHATSKISVADDLDRISTMGFRGEALASITSVSRVSIRSRTAQEESASLLEAEGDRVEPVRPAAGPKGTSVSVRNLFFNTPARRKFLRTPATEQGHALDVVYTLAIAHPGIGFIASVDGRQIFDVPAAQGPKDRALEVLGRELAPHLLEVHADQFDDSRGVALWGLVGTPEIARATQKGQHLFLNGRIIRDKTVQHAVREAYRGLIEPGRYPTAVLMLEMNPGAVDVNVHPSKAEVRFRDQSVVHSVILRSVRDALRLADLTPSVMTSSTDAQKVHGIFGAGSLPGQPAGGGSGSSDWRALGGSPGEHASPAEVHRELVDFLRKPPHPERLHAQTWSSPTPLQAGALRDALSQPQTPLDAAQAQSALALSEPPLFASPKRDDRLLQVHNSYVVTQDEHGLLIVDQHALHERVMFEALLRRVTGLGAPAQAAGESGAGDPGEGKPVATIKPLESQRLLVPAVVAATRTQIARLEDLAPLFARIGIIAEPLGAESIGVQSFPTFLFERGVDPQEFLAELLDRSESEGFAPESEQALADVLDMMACKAAVKAGDHMSDPELRDLLRLRDVVERSSNCPHGRPTSIRLTIKELEKRFGRV